jgi:RND family efflux transporter MFP subunit
LRRAGWWTGGLVLLLLTGAAVRGYSNTRAAAQLADESANDAVRAVFTITPKPVARGRNVTLPATLRGLQEAAVVARTGGYLQRWTKDIGDRVKAGELLAVIDAPEAEEELRQARATLEQVRATAALTQSALVRYEQLGERDAVSKQELDERRAARAKADADLAGAQANVKRLEALAALRRVVAPFDGVVIRRSAEVGQLISTGTARELYYLAQTDRLRIDLAVPQVHAADVQTGQTVQVRWPDRPGTPTPGRIARTAPGLDTATRTRQVVVELDNPGQRLLPGAYVEVVWAPPKARGADAGDGPLLVPTGVLQFRQEGPRIAVVEQGRIALRNVQIGRDLGRTVEILDGIGPKDQLVLNPPDVIVDGEAVSARPAPDDAAQKTAGPGDKKAP